MLRPIHVWYRLEEHAIRTLFSCPEIDTPGRGSDGVATHRPSAGALAAPRTV